MGYSKLNKFVALFQQTQKFYIHSFSPFYEIILGRIVLMENNSCIDYFRKSTVISGRIFHHKELEPCDVNSSKNV